MTWKPDRLAVHLLAALAVTVLLGWLSTGTLAGYAVGLDIARVWMPCRYLVNVDHLDFRASFLMLGGAPPQTWAWAVTLRRVLYPLIAFPAMSALGFEHGGILVNFLLAGGAVVGFSLWVRRRHGERSAIAVAWLVATFPALHYWIGLPYSYALVVPASLAAVAAVHELDAREDPRAVARLSLLLGVLYVGYDLAPFFLLPALALVTLRTRRAGTVLLSLAAQVAPTALTLGVMTGVLGVPLQNSNSGIYQAVLGAWMHAAGASGWAPLLARAPLVLLQNFLASAFVWLPLLFLLALAGPRRAEGPRLARPEKALLAMVLAVWCFNNLAPPYPGKWQMRGEWIARLYVPVFAVYLTVIARWLAGEGDARGGFRRTMPVAVAVALDALVVLGPFLGLTGYTARMYAAFYAHAPPGASYGRDPVRVTEEHLQALGRRPLGFCEPPPPPPR